MAIDSIKPNSAAIQSKPLPEKKSIVAAKPEPKESAVAVKPAPKEEEAAEGNRKDNESKEKVTVA